MLVTRRRGFTLIELLVVIAIIGILAAMLFPVFARARESARKVQCLSNVKNIAMAMQMYLSDYDKFLPLGNQDEEAADYFDSQGSGYSYPSNICNHERQANPFAREQVILDEYIKNHDVWSCPSALVMTYASNIVPIGSKGTWVSSFEVDHPDWKSASWYSAPRPCNLTWPPGWGGDITDSFVQGWTDGGAPGAAAFGIGLNDNMHWDTPQAVNDVSHYIVCADTGETAQVWSLKSLAMPDDYCAFNTCGIGNPGCCGDGNGPTELTDAEKKAQVWTDGNWRRQRGRHMGGVNVGFLDGHAKWFDVNTIIDQAQHTQNAMFEGGMCYCPNDWTIQK